ncbi:DeoR/GlpR family DNA-binding transcription regulator [Saccharibacillus sp. CPCC 101409]|uniref:DeoR/GlpR family DNA-binding transcription regulator n=1 Tax=Saccharibacillus sp. CPCC 101409 TaxID=3058041 RepID=UPI0026733ADD|nr:DeoR/GlpR family DNA-binding transcription regulator [Saccharibacillus sp. CPCC 101409]MDO3412517.1 DeoR/GlpR family DNA-binding transcription regulator [Saccharibacillus sp. CPCC 101409]
MLPLQRKQELIAYLADKGAATLKELSLRFGVSEMTIRRDLNMLQRENVIRRSHGGAVYQGEQTQIERKEPAIPDKEASNRAIKGRLAAYAARHFVRSGDTVALENGTTVSRMAEHLDHVEELTLLTNGMDTFNLFRPYANARRTLISSGGILREKSGTLVGPEAENFFARYHADTLFLSALGFTPEAGFTDPNLLDTQVKKMMIRSARKVVMLLDSSKFGQRFLSPVASLQDINMLVTDQGLSRENRAVIEESGVELHIV